MMLFPMPSFLASTFPKIVKKSIFYRHFVKKFKIFSKIYPKFVFFIQTREELAQIWNFIISQIYGRAHNVEEFFKWAL